MNPARVAVTGGAGFIGRWTVRELVGRGARVTILDLPERPAWVPDAVRYIQGTVEDPAIIDSALTGADAVCHLAFRMDLEGDDPVTSHRINVVGSTTVMDSALRLRVPRMVWSSSVMVFGPRAAYQAPVVEDAEPMPRTCYGSAKLALEWTARAFRTKGLETVALRFTTVFGPGRERPGVAPFAVDLFEGVASDRGVRLAEGDRGAAMLYVPDAAQASAKSLLNSGPLRDVYNITGFEVTIRELAHSVRSCCPEADVQVAQGGTSPWPTSIDSHAAQRDFGFSPEFDCGRACQHYLNFLRHQREAS